MEFNKETAKAVISAVVLVLVDVLAAVGIAADPSTVASAVYLVLLIAATLYGCWKNHNFTQAAQEAQKKLDELKDK